jgi:hypothetical protein
MQLLCVLFFRHVSNNFAKEVTTSEDIEGNDALKPRNDFKLVSSCAMNLYFSLKATGETKCVAFALYQKRLNTAVMSTYMKNTFKLVSSEMKRPGSILSYSGWY